MKKLLFLFLLCLVFTSKVYAETCEYSFPMAVDRLARSEDKSDTNFYLSFDLGSSGVTGGLTITYGKDRKSVYNGDFWSGQGKLWNTDGNGYEVTIPKKIIDATPKAIVKFTVKKDDINKISKTGNNYFCPSSGWFNSFIGNLDGSPYDGTKGRQYYVWFKVLDSQASSTSVHRTKPSGEEATEVCDPRNEVLTSSDKTTETCIQVQYSKIGGKYIPTVQQWSSYQCGGDLKRGPVVNDTGKNWQVVVQNESQKKPGYIYTFTSTLSYVNSCSEADTAPITTTDTPPGGDPSDQPGDGTTPDTPGIDVTSDPMTCKQIVGENGVKLIKFGLTTIRIAGAIIAIVVGMMNFIPAVAKKDNDELQRAAKKSVYMAIILVLILILPTIITVIAKMFDFDVSCFV